MGLARITVLFLALVPGLAAQPGIGQNGVVNSASQIPPTLPGGAIARGALFTIRGVRLASAGPTEITITGQGATMAATVLNAVPRTIQALMPRIAPLGSASLIVTAGGRASKPFPVKIVESNPGIFSRNLEGWGPGTIENIGDDATHSPNSYATPVRRGQRIRIAITGMSPGQQAIAVIGNRRVTGTVTRAYRDGEEQIILPIPGDAPLGCFVPLYLLASPSRASNVVTVSIGSGQCDPGPVPLWSRKNMVVVAVSRSVLKSDKPNAPDTLSDDARVVVKSGAQDAALSRNDLIPSPGTCTASTGSYQSDDLTLSLSSIGALDAQGLDSGAALTLSQGSERREIAQARNHLGHYRAKLGVGGVDLRRGLPRLFLNPGEFVLKAPGGQDTDPFSLVFSMTPPFQWTDEITAIDRKRGVTIHWRNPARDRMLILVRNVDLITTAVGMCLCVAPIGATQFTIPPELLANVPATQKASGERFDRLALGSLAVKPLGAIRGKGLDSAIAFTVYDVTRFVEYR